MNMVLNHYFRPTLQNGNASYWAVGPEVQRDSVRTDDEPGRSSIPDFVVFQYGFLLRNDFGDIDNSLASFGIFEHTIIECKRTGGIDFEGGMLQLSLQCKRMEKAGDSCFAILNIGFKVWFFEYLGSDLDENVWSKTYKSTGLAFITPFILYQDYNPLKGFDLIADRYQIHSFFTYLAAYKYPRLYNLG